MKTFKSFIEEGLLSDFFGLSWRKVGDTVKGSIVAKVLSSSTYFSDEQISDFKKMKFVVKDIDVNTAKKYRKFTDNNSDGEVFDSIKLDRARAREFTYESLMKNPPIIDKDGFVWDGNHRLMRAIELKMDKIPVLMEK